MMLKLTIEVEVDDNIYGQSKEEMDWMNKEILIGDGSLLLHSNEIGDTIGEIKKVSDIQWVNSK